MWFISALLGVFTASIPAIVGRVLLVLGLGFVTYEGAYTLFDWIFKLTEDYVKGMPADVVSLLSYLWVDRALSMVWSAYGVAVGIKTLGLGKIARTFIK